MHPNEQWFRDLYAAYERGEDETVLAAYAPDVRLHVSGGHRISGDYEGFEAFRAAYETWEHSVERATGRRPVAELHDVVANDRHVVALLRSRYPRADGTTFDQNEVWVHDVRDGQIVEVWTFDGDQARADAYVESIFTDASPGI